ncbi:MAG TPA: DUF445 family protein [Pyrinomonadaceae bacterium]|nr:DUF445 family protein [Chloracidobacterium sp.]HQX54296.1 DUF445 family protein [Pyrinomonadaceae bacterium]MBK9436720.1 DUF445 family protein [Chloracidobacterium sp.]MBK9766348.1 DUF445 family protein [Chloracidobacterium sp.]MBL0241710.1 DUF445 family protein [Chloracidobacterium sp.]
MQDLLNNIQPIFKNLYVQIALLIVFATAHGYAGAWLAVRMLFRPRNPVRVLGITVFPQGMIPRHRDRLANAIGKAVGDELVSHDTIIEQLTGNDFLRRKIQNVVDTYTSELLSQNYPSIIETLPKNVREPILDAISGLQLRLSEHITAILKSSESTAAISSFVTRRVDDVLSKRVSEVIDDEAFSKITSFLEQRIRSAVEAPSFENKIREFIGRRINDLAGSETPLGELFTQDAVALLKEKANEQVEPAIRQLTELAASERTRNQIGALIKKEVHEYYENLPFYKKIFVSRENLLHEVDSLVNESLPRRIEETLRGEFFADEARNFIGSSIDNALAKPLPVAIGAIAPEQLDRLKEQVAGSVLGLIRGDEMIGGITSYINEALEGLRPHSIDSILRTIHPEAEEKLKSMLSRGLLDILAREETAHIINEMLAGQIDKLLSQPIGRIGDHISEEKVRDASTTLTDAIIAAVHAKLPDAVAEFDVGGVVREKIHNYPAEKLESLVMSVAKEHLRTIELFGALFGFLIGVAQAIQFYFYAK